MKTLITGFSCLLFCGCAIDFGARVKQTTTDTNGVIHVYEGSIRPAVTWGDATQAKAKQRISNTKSGNSIGVIGFDQETSASNVAPIIKSTGGLIGEAVSAYQESQGIPKLGTVLPTK